MMFICKYHKITQEVLTTGIHNFFIQITDLFWQRKYQKNVSMSYADVIAGITKDVTSFSIHNVLFSTYNYIN